MTLPAIFRPQLHLHPGPGVDIGRHLGHGRAHDPHMAVAQLDKMAARQLGVGQARQAGRQLGGASGCVRRDDPGALRAPLPVHPGRLGTGA